MSKRWADEGDDNENDVKNDFTRTVDEKGVVTESFVRVDRDPLDDTTRRVRVTKKYKEIKKVVRVNKAVQDRRTWAKFGDCKGVPPGVEMNITYQQSKPVELEFMKAKVESTELKISKKCRKCGGPHWTIKCPFFSGPGPSKEDEGPENRPGASKLGLGNSSGSQAYRPPNVGNLGSSREDTRRDDPTLRVTNVSEDTTDGDLRELFGAFGITTRVFLALHKDTMKSRGFAFISYQNRESAQKAIDKLHGHGYDNLILHVEWAKPREDRPSGNSEEKTSERLRAIQNAQRRRF